MTARLALALALLLLVVPAFAAAPDYAGMQVQSYDTPRPAPAFGLPALDGRTVRLDDLRGKVAMLVFWATW
jgi:cytochrome oxidase Cu insertion factor (SCO1/SenC/PrrC family)